MLKCFLSANTRQTNWRKLSKDQQLQDSQKTGAPTLLGEADIVAHVQPGETGVSQMPNSIC